MTATTVSQAVAQRDSGPISLMWESKTHFAAILPDHIEVKGFLGTAAAALYGNTQLMAAAKNAPDSLITALMRCAALGHQPGTDEYYLTPRTIKGRLQILGIEGYRGVIERMYRSGAVRKVVVREVCAKDPFRFVEGVDPVPVHEIGGRGTTGADFFGATGSRDRGAMVGVYAYAELMTGAISRVVVLTRDDVHAARGAGGWKPDDDFSPWNKYDGGQDHPEFQGRSMWWKTGAKRLEPWVPTSAEYRREQLRAAAGADGMAAARASGPAPAAPPPDLDIHDAELVDEPAAPPQPAAPRASRQSRQPDAETGPGPGRPGSNPGARPTSAALAKLGKALTKVRLGTPEDVAVFLAWAAGRSEATRLEALTHGETTQITEYLDEALKAADNDSDVAGSRIWTAYRDAHPAPEPDDTDSEAADE
jgi:recombination protein RecT